MAQYIDGHCHVHCADYPVSGAEVIENARKSGVEALMAMGCDVADSQRAVDYAARYDSESVKVYCGVGVFPSYADDFGKATISVLRMLAQKSQGVVAIGEIGIDHHDDDHHLPSEQQIRALEAQLQLAVDLNLPASLHCRSGKYGNAFADLQVALGNFTGRNAVRGVLHSFTDSLGNLERCLGYGLSIGVNGIVTFNRDAELDEVYQAIPTDKIILETDAPYLAPRPYRGRVNQPAYLPEVVTALAGKRDVDPEALALACYNNASDLFGLRGGNAD